MVIVYTHEELLGLCSRDVRPVRAVRKSIFRHQLWQPAYERKQTWLKTRRPIADSDDVSVPTPATLAKICCQIWIAERAVGWQLVDCDRFYSQQGTLCRLSADGNVAHVA